MNVVVCLKQTFDTEAKIVLDAQGKVDANGVNLIINPYDEYAIEEGIRLKEKFGGEVTVVSMGGAKVAEALRTALAMGADKAIAIQDPASYGSDEYVTAQVLAKALKEVPFDVILSGRIAIDDGSSQVAVRLAEQLGIPSVTSIMTLSVEGNKAVVTRDIDGGMETVEITLPAVLTAQKGLNEPRYPSVAGIMKAKKKEFKTFTLKDLGMDHGDAGFAGAKMKLDSISLPAPRQAGRVIQGEPVQAVSELVRVLMDEAKVI
ncbi:MAG: electron transfer flavoprotein subunit beta/FixA family protein [Desulfitobacteriaceae bacterium]|nr:electron transfer flavoprotein subunit beta/FixA family protein [Desulfitobacteriaceae bacterium]MDI6880081.1 electron transfer flavoprotein subunit beta/FixA family protein [Desulfitobacteriaceae bacterium]MDI6913218.1 electron transfer flavoprotein subunit beta/FixA family protein [Desulfitobacteriaceae bacterium]